MADSLLVASARLAECTTPLTENAGECAAAKVSQAQLDLLACRALQRWSDDQETGVAPLRIALLEPEQLPEPTVKPEGRVVEVPKPEVEEAPEQSRFVSEHNTKAEKETVARGADDEEFVARPGLRDLPVAAPSKRAAAAKQAPAAEGATAPRRPGLLSMRHPDQLGDKDLAPPVPRVGAKDSEISPQGTLPHFSDSWRPVHIPHENGRKGHGSELPGGPGGWHVPDLRPSQELLSRFAGGGSVDYFDDVEDGEVTALNSKKWKFATFFNRMKRQVAENWDPNQVYMRRDPTGQVYGTKDRITVLRVSLKRDGSLAQVIVESPSGVDFLDDEAIRAFRAAQPFPNPPSALLDRGSDLITFSFQFHYLVGERRVRWKVFRYR